MSLIIDLETHDVRFPTSRQLDGSDAMNPDPDYSAAYVVLRTDAPDRLCGHGFVFTIGRGNNVQTSAPAALRPFVVGRRVDEVIHDLGGFARSLTHDSQLRWLGPENGVMHLASPDDTANRYRNVCFLAGTPGKNDDARNRSERIECLSEVEQLGRGLRGPSTVAKRLADVSRNASPLARTNSASRNNP
jgi:hypothetical protein